MRSGRGRGSQNNNMVAIRRLQNRMVGHKVAPAPNPPTFVQLPWNNWTFERTEETANPLQLVTIKVEDILGQLRGRLGLRLLDDASPANVRIKIQSAQVWCTAASLILPDVEANFYGVASASSGPRSNQRDIGTLNMPARCGYVYPIADQKELLYNDQKDKIVLDAKPAAQGSQVTFRVQVLWQSSA